MIEFRPPRKLFADGLDGRALQQQHAAEPSVCRLRQPGAPSPTAGIVRLLRPPTEFFARRNRCVQRGWRGKTAAVAVAVAVTALQLQYGKLHYPPVDGCRCLHAAAAVATRLRVCGRPERI